MPTLEDMLPDDYLALYQDSPPPPVQVSGPLPDLITHHYSSGGCWILAAALHQATNWPIELYFRDGQPRHAYITDGVRAIDAIGARSVAAARAGAERQSQVDFAGLIALLATIPNGEIILRDLRRPKSQVAAEKTAAALLEVAGMPLPPWEHLSS
jgi:hypothetical protein